MRRLSLLKKEIYSEKHGNVAAIYNNLGIVYRDLGQYSQAKEYCEKALIITKETYGENNGDVAVSYNDLGVLYRKLGQYCEAREYFEKALILEKKFTWIKML